MQQRPLFYYIEYLTKVQVPKGKITKPVESADSRTLVIGKCKAMSVSDGANSINHLTLQFMTCQMLCYFLFSVVFIGILKLSISLVHYC